MWMNWGGYATLKIRKNPMIITKLQNMRLSAKLIYLLGHDRAEELIARFEKFLPREGKILDMGCGVGNISEILINKKYNVVSLDISNKSFSPVVTPVLYDGVTFPFADNSFDTVLLITVLHHTPSPETIMKETARVAKNVIIIEDIYTNPLEKYTTFFFDSLFNLEFQGHPHTNKTDAEWKKLFADLGLSLTHTQYQRSYGVFNHALYHITTK